MIIKHLKYAGLGLLLCALNGSVAWAGGVNVLELQLKADGKTDNTAALQAALDAGKTDLYFPAGEYYLGSVKIPAESRLVFNPRARIKPNPSKKSAS